MNETDAAAFLIAQAQFVFIRDGVVYARYMDRMLCGRYAASEYPLRTGDPSAGIIHRPFFEHHLYATPEGAIAIRNEAS